MTYLKTKYKLHGRPFDECMIVGMTDEEGITHSKK